MSSQESKQKCGPGTHWDATAQKCVPDKGTMIVQFEMYRGGGGCQDTTVRIPIPPESRDELLKALLQSKGQ
jgi:hypothetical protein